MSAYSVRCPTCGKRLSSTARICTACGTEQPMHVQRIRCHYCSRRVPANVTPCPYCQHDPRGFYFRPHLFLVTAGLIVFGLLVWAAFNVPVWVNSLALHNPSPPTLQATRSPIVLVVTATPSSSPTSAPTLVPIPTDTVLAVSTITPTLTATATRRVARSSPTRTQTATVTPTLLAAPILLSPENGTRFQGSRRTVVLTFQPAPALGANQWYRVQVNYTDRNNQASSWCGWTKGDPVPFPSDYYGDSSPFDRIFRWHVELVTSGPQSPTTCNAPTTSLSTPSAVWVFYWY